MMSEQISKKFNHLLHDINLLLSSRGFVRRGRSFRKSFEKNDAIIEFQKSMDSSDGALIFTVNLGILCGALFDYDQSALRKASSMDAHLRQRIGMLLPERRDKWWTITSSTDEHSLSDEFKILISEVAVPYLEKFSTTDTLVDLWESGVSPGLTAGQRARFLSQIKANRAV